MAGIFTISLDFELHWGGFEKWPLERIPNSGFGIPNEPFLIPAAADKYFSPTKNYNEYFLNTRRVIPHLLSLFSKHEIHVTWATVGMLFTPNRSALMEVSPAVKPTYKIPQLSAYHYIQHSGIGENEKADPFHFAASLVDQVFKTPGQELGTHTYAHYYCNEPGQTIDQFRTDLQSVQKAALRLNRNLTSLVFPRNQFNDAYLNVCYEEGIKAVRSNPLDWFWNIQSTRHESAWLRLNRGLDAYVPIGKKNTYKLESIVVRPGFPICLPASRLLRPYNPKEFFLNNMKIARIKNEMERAAKANEVYHLWWHPHNFGNYPAESLKGLEEILKHFDYCRKRYAMETLTMGETAERLI